MASASDLNPSRPPLSRLLHFVIPELCLALVLALYPPKSARLLFLLGLAYWTSRAYAYTAGSAYDDCGAGTQLIIHWLNAALFLWLSDPLREYRHDKDSVSPGQLPFSRRVLWALSLNMMLPGRLVGWNKQVANIPPPPTMDRWTFVRVRALQTLRHIAFLDVCQTYFYTSSLFDGIGDASVPVMSQGYFLGCIGVFAWGHRIVAQTTLWYNAAAMVAVASGVWEPKYWPELFGDWADAYTVRRFWGRSWHQLLRRNFTSFGNYTVSTLGFKPGTKSSSYTQLYIAFFISGLIHVSGDVMMEMPILGPTMPFFLSQAVVITLEDASIGLANIVGFSRGGPWTRVVGYVWVCVWLSVSVPWYLDWFTKAGASRTPLLPFSLVKYVPMWWSRV